MKIVILLSCVVIFTSAVPMPGGLGELQTANQEVQALANELKSVIAHHAGVEGFSEFTAISFKKQPVAGVNYFVKIRVGPNNYIHARLYVRSWENVKQVSAVQTGKSLMDPIEYFESRPLLS